MNIFTRRTMLKTVVGGSITLVSSLLMPKDMLAMQDSDSDYQPAADCGGCDLPGPWSECFMLDGRMRKTRTWYRCWVAGGYYTNPCSTDVCNCDASGHCSGIDG